MSHVITAPAAREAAGGSPEIRIEQIDDFDHLERFATAWNDLLEKSGSDAYLTIDWMRTWWRHYGKRRTLRILLARRGERLVGGLPICIRTIWLGPLRIRLAQLVGADSTISVLAPPILPGCDTAVLRPCLEIILNEWRIDALSLSPLSGGSTIGAAVESLCGPGSSWTIMCDESIGPHTLFHLPGSFDEYLLGLAKRQRSNLRRDLNLLKKSVNLEQRVHRGSEAAEHFNRFVELHREQWRAAGQLGHFKDWPGSEAFNRELAEVMSTGGEVCLFELMGNGETLAMQYCFVVGDTCCWRLPARRAGAEFDRMGLGRVGLVKMIESLIAMGVRRVEAGPGHYDYKLKHGGEEYQLTRLVIARRGIFPRWRARALLAWADFLNLAYYRGWFTRIAPRIRLQRALWQSWIRTRI